MFENHFLFLIKSSSYDLDFIRHYEEKQAGYKTQD